MWSAALRVDGCERGVGWLLFRVGWFVALPVGAPFMTPGAGTAHVVGRVACRRMRAGRWLNVVSRWLVCGVARGGAIHDARCRNGTCGRSRCVSVDVGGAAVGLRFFVGRFAASPVRAPFMTPGAGTAHVVGRVVRRWMWAGRRLIVVLWRLVCGVARGGAIHGARCRNGTCGWPRCVSADVGGAAIGLSFCGGRLRHFVGHPGVTSGAPTFASVGLQFFVGCFVA